MMRGVCEECGEGVTFVLDRGRFVWVHDTTSLHPLYMGGSSRHHARPDKATVTAT